MRVWKPHGGKVHALAFSTDGRTLATAGGVSRFVWLWDAITGEGKAKLDAHTAQVLAIEFSPVGQYFASLQRGGRVLVWNYESEHPAVVNELHVEMQEPFSLAFAPDGERLVAACHQAIVWWDRPTQPKGYRLMPTNTESRELRPPVYSARYLRDGSWFLVGSRNLEIWRPDLRTPFDFVEPHRRSGIRSLAISPDNTRVAIALKNSARVCRFANREWEPVIHYGRAMVYAVAFSHDGRSLITAGADGTVRTWDVATRQEIRSLDWGIGKVHLVVFSPDGLTCAAGGEKGQVVVWDVDA